MSISAWLTSCFSGSRKAMSLYKRGMAKAKKRDHQGALEVYTTLIGLPGTPADLLPMVLYNRALAYMATGDDRRGAADLDTVLAMNEAQVNVRTMARHKLAGMQSRVNKNKV